MLFKKFRKNKKNNEVKIVHNSNFKTIKRLWNMSLKKYMLEIFIVIVFIFIFASANAGSLSLLKVVTDKGFMDKDFKTLKIISLEIVGLFFVKAVALYLNTYILYNASLKLTNRMRNMMFVRLMKMDMNYFENNTSGVLVTRIINDCVAAGELLRQLFTVFLKELFTVLGLFFVMIYQAPTLSLFSFITIPVIFFMVRYLNYKIRIIYSGAMSKTEDVFSYLTQVFQNMPIIKIYTREKYETRKANSIFKSLMKLQKKTFKNQALSRPIIEIITGIAIGLCLFIGGYFVTKGQMSTGSFMVFFVCLVTIYNPLKQVVGVIPQIQTLIISAERVFITYDTIPDVQDKKDATNLIFKNGKIEFNNITFKYKGIEKYAINDVSFVVNPGEVIALVGSSGAGKSTIVKLISRFYNLTSGEILIDKQNISNVTQESLHKYMSMVTQDVFLFNDTIRNNIAYGALLDPEDVKDDLIINAAKKADAYEFIMNMPQQFDTIIGERGVKLSGGQKQRISIARAILKNAPILLLDEATSALDTKSERAVQAALYSLMENRTSIVIAHRLSTIINSDRILVIEEGTLIEQGTHEELLIRNGRYKELYNIQFKNM